MKRPGGKKGTRERCERSKKEVGEEGEGNYSMNAKMSCVVEGFFFPSRWGSGLGWVLKTPFRL